MTENQLAILKYIEECEGKASLINLNQRFMAGTDLVQDLLDKGLIALNLSTQTVSVVKDNGIYHATEGSAGADVFTTEEITIKKKTQVIVPSNLYVDGRLAKDEMFMLTPRSSFFGKHSLLLTNSVGIIDSDYPNVVGFMYYNIGSKDVVLPSGEAIGQVIALKVLRNKFPTIMKKRTGGYGSTSGSDQSK